MKQYSFARGIGALLLIAALTLTPLPVRGALSLRMGDVNGDGSVDAADALLALQHSVQLRFLNEAEMSMADVTADHTIDAQDALNILQHSVGLIRGFANQADGKINWKFYYGIDGKDFDDMTSIQNINDSAEVIDKLGGVPEAAEIETYPIDDFNRLIYNPISREAAKIGRLNQYSTSSKLTGTVETGGVTVRYRVPKKVTAYDAVPIEYSISGYGSGYPFYIEAVAHEESARAKGDYYDLALPGNVDMTFSYDGYVAAEFDNSLKPVLSGKKDDRQGTSYPSYHASELVRSGTLPVADQIWLKFTYTNTGDTILDCDGNGSICFEPVLYKQSSDGRWLTDSSYQMENRVERPTDYIYPGESGEMWVSFQCRGLSQGNYQLQITGKINNEQDVPNWERSFNWGVNTTFSSFTFSVSKDAVLTQPDAVVHSAPRDIVRNGWMRTYEEFMTSYEAIIDTDGAAGTMYLQCAPWTEYIVLKVMTANQDNIRLVRIPVEVESDSIRLYLNEDNSNYIVRPDGTREPMVVAQTMADMRSNIQRGPDAASTIINDLTDMKEAGVNYLSSTISFGYDVSSSASASVNEDANKFMMDVARTLGFQMEGYSSYPYDWPGRYSQGVAGISAPTFAGGFADPAIHKANAALANYTFQRYADLLYQAGDGTIPLTTEDTRGWIRMDYSGIFDFKKDTEANFAAWLKNKYSTIDALNAAYGSNYDSYDDMDILSQASAFESGYSGAHVFFDSGSVFHDGSIAMADFNLYRTVERVNGYVAMLAQIPSVTPPKNTVDTVINPKVVIRTEGANFLTAGIDPATDNAHFRHVYYAQRRNGMVAEIVQASGTVFGHADYTTIPYTPSEIYELVSHSTEQGVVEYSMAMFNNMQDLVMNSRYGRDKFMTDYNIDGANGTVLGAYVITQAALFPWFKAMYEAGGVPGILWQDYLCNGMCTATQYKELKFFHQKMEEMLATDEGKAWSANFVQLDQSWRETTATAWSYPPEYVAQKVSEVQRNCVFEGRYRS